MAPRFEVDPLWAEAAGQNHWILARPSAFLSTRRSCLDHSSRRLARTGEVHATTNATHRDVLRPHPRSCSSTGRQSGFELGRSGTGL
jgi:hypothetical protein